MNYLPIHIKNQEFLVFNFDNEIINVDIQRNADLFDKFEKKIIN